MKYLHRWMRGILLAGATALLLSCGGGGGGGTSAGGVGLGGSAAVGGGSGDGSPAGTGGSGGTGTAGGSDGTGTGGTGTGGTGTGGGSDGTSTAGNGTDDGSGVGSGGTGVSTADATGVGSVGGIGSIILNGVRYKTYPEASDGINPANFDLEDTNELQIGMSVRIAGKIDSQFTAATAQQVVSAAELRGAVSSIDLAGGSFVVMGATVTTDNATVWSGGNSLSDLVAASQVQVWGLPSTPGTLRATRVELKPASAEPLVTGFVQNLDRLGKSFMLGQITVRYSGALFSGGIDESTLAEGAIVRVRGITAPFAGTFNATKVQGWYAIPTQNTAAVQLAGIVANYNGLGDFKVLGTAVNASNALITGGLASSIGNGVKVELDGFMTNGLLVVKKLRIRNIPGVGGPVDFTLIGAIGGYQSASDFRVQGRRVDAGRAGVEFIGGTTTELANGRRVTVVGDAVENGVLIAKRVTFTP
ncbi:DUF5666 domain-containing protein [Variovorax sp. DXTD-1]|uniref:DUF5666 domain-containing protein n=1 Tax=Variovorax sp. DXTD-1 TaxID=2495592 RepID=UPI000F85CE73|nr:DUF5666 domain-containing protein [Variovorax sp. DXTD-1]RST53972.1 hypothetical protein EJI00_02245 [Variovorax sp. DXTD-1]